MDSYQDKKSKLLHLKSHILRMPNTIKKVHMISGYENLLYYYDAINKLSDCRYNELALPDDFMDKYNQYLQKDTQKNINAINNNALYLYNKYQEIIDEYKKNDFCSFDIDNFNKVKSDHMYSLLGDFFALLGDDLLNLYNKMIKSGNIFLTNSSDCFGMAMNSISIDNPCIIIQNVEQYIDYYYTLAHEMGHCYQFYLQRNQQNYAAFNPYSEITSLLFEKLFNYYLKNIHFVNDNFYELEDHIYFLNDVSASKVLCQLFLNKNISNINSWDLSYDYCGSCDELLSLMEHDCGYIMSNKRNLELDEFHYSIGNVIATYFMDKLRNNFNLEWENFKEFICSINYLTLDEVLEKYFDVNLMKENIKSFIKSYRT